MSHFVLMAPESVSNLGYLTSKGWDAWTDDDPQVATSGQWSTATAKAPGTASNSGGFLFNNSIDGVNRKRVAKTGYTDLIEGGSTDPAKQFEYGIWLKPNTVVDMGPVARLGEYPVNKFYGYGKSTGILIGVENRLSPFTYDSHSGVLKGGKRRCNVDGRASDVGGIGVANYGIIDFSEAQGYKGLGNFLLGSCVEVGGIGVLNWGAFKGSSGGDNISGFGELSGIYNSADLGTPEKDPFIATGGGGDSIIGWAPAGKSGVYNDGLIDMGNGGDLFSSVVTPFVEGDQPVVGYFGGSGTVVMGRGDDVVTGFGDGEFWGGRYGKADSIAPGNRDSLELVSGLTYVITETSTSGKNGKSIAGFSINSGERTMNVFGFDTFGTSDEDQIPLAPGTYTLPFAPVG